MYIKAILIHNIQNFPFWAQGEQAALIGIAWDHDVHTIKCLCVAANSRLQCDNTKQNKWAMPEIPWIDYTFDCQLIFGHCAFCYCPPPSLCVCVCPNKVMDHNLRSKFQKRDWKCEMIWSPARWRRVKGTDYLSRKRKVYLGMGSLQRPCPEQG